MRIRTIGSASARVPSAWKGERLVTGWCFYIAGYLKSLLLNGKLLPKTVAPRGFLSDPYNEFLQAPTPLGKRLSYRSWDTGICWNQAGTAGPWHFMGWKLTETEVVELGGKNCETHWVSLGIAQLLVVRFFGVWDECGRGAKELPEELRPGWMRGGLTQWRRVEGTCRDPSYRGGVKTSSPESRGYLSRAPRKWNSPPP